MQPELIRTEIVRLMRQVPFVPFFIMMENGDRVFVEHPENIAFDAGITGQRPGSREFRALTGGMWYFGTFDKVSLAQRDLGDSTDGQSSASSSQSD